MKLFFIILTGLLAIPTFAQTTGTETQGEAENEEPVSLGSLAVTGTRLTTGDDSLRLDVMTAEDISDRGLATIEDIIRAIPQNFAGFGDFTNNEMLFTVGGGITTGIQMANLRGLGSENTLILVNGRRRAGVAGDDVGYNNIANIPAAMIERVEILLGGASAVYGSDAIGGVINFITKKNYSGLSVHTRVDMPGNAGNGYYADATGGYSWGSGGISATLSYRSTEPVENAKAGWTTSDYRYMHDAHPEVFIGDREDYDKREDGAGQPGFVTVPGVGIFTLPIGHNGINADISDFIDISGPGVRANFLSDYIPEFTGSETRTTSFNGSIEQEVTPRLMLRGEWAYSRVESEQEPAPPVTFFDVPATNAYNPFGQDVRVNYLPLAEMESGLVSQAFNSATNESTNFNTGFDYDIGGNLLLSATYLWSESYTDAVSMRFMGNSTGSPDHDDPLTVILANSDPGQTINVFGNGTAQTDVISTFFAKALTVGDKTRVTQLESHFAGSVFLMPAGNIGFVLGGEMRTESLILPADSSRLESWTGGLITPERDSHAFFAELSIPLFSRMNESKYAKLLTLNIQARYDDYSLVGADGANEDGSPNLIDATFDAVSPRVGLAYKPIDDLAFRLSGARSFRAPTFNRMFDLTPFPEFYATLPLLRFYDLLAPGGPAVVKTGLARSGNPDLKPEKSTQWNLGFTWTPKIVPGLWVNADYSRIDYTDRIVSGGALFRDLPPEELAGRTDILIRDEEGNAITQIWSAVNAYSRISEDLSIDVMYRFDTGWGNFEPGINYAKVIKLVDQYTRETPPVDLAGTSRGLDDYRIYGRLAWVKDNWSALLGINHTPGYLNNQVDVVFGSPSAFHQVEDYTTIDLTVAYRWNNGVTLRAGGRNITDTDFPFAVLDNQITGATPYDPSRVNPYGRVLFLDISFDL